MAGILIVPGLRNSGPTHWQTWMELQLPDTERVEQADWTQPRLPEWASNVSSAIARSEGKVWIIAHSFGCLASVAASAGLAARIHGAMLVAPADPERFELDDARLQHKLEFPSLVVASGNDPWVRVDVAERWARRWGSRLLYIGKAGHINAESGHGPWPQGLQLFESLRGSSTP